MVYQVIKDHVAKEEPHSKTETNLNASLLPPKISEKKKEKLITAFSSLILGRNYLKYFDSNILPLYYFF